MLRKLVLAAALVATSAFAQQSTDISGADFNSGAADAALAGLGRAAAASGKRLVITAPADWHARIAAKLRAGGDASVILRDGFYENVLVRVEDPSASEPAAAAAPPPSQVDLERSRAEAERAKAEAARSRAEAEKAKAEAERVRAEADRARAEADLARLRAQQAAAAAAAAAPAPAAPAAGSLATLPTSPAATPEDGEALAEAGIAAARGRLEQSLVAGRRAEGTMSVAALESGDQIYVDGSVRAVIRREGLRPVLYWLEGDLDLRRAELKVLGNDRYQVLGAIRGESGALRSEFDDAPPLVAQEPAADAPARLALEQSLNGGRTIVERLPVARLRAGDQVFAGDGVAVVVRREGDALRRYWLAGSLDVRQSGVRADGVNRYRILTDNLR